MKITELGRRFEIGFVLSDGGTPFTISCVLSPECSPAVVEEVWLLLEVVERDGQAFLDARRGTEAGI